MGNKAFEAVEAEIRKEKAEALGRAGERLECALRELNTYQQELLGLLAFAQLCGPDGGEGFWMEIQERLATYARLFEQARQFRHFLIIQREAVGLRRHDDVDRQYPLPAPLPPAGLTRHEGVA
jgi:hypothetical protein